MMSLESIGIYIMGTAVKGLARQVCNVAVTGNVQGLMRVVFLAMRCHCCFDTMQ